MAAARTRRTMKIIVMTCRLAARHARREAISCGQALLSLSGSGDRERTQQSDVEVVRVHQLPGLVDVRPQLEHGLIVPASLLITVGTNAAMTSRRSRVWSGGSVKTRLDWTASGHPSPQAEWPAATTC